VQVAYPARWHISHGFGYTELSVFSGDADIAVMSDQSAASNAMSIDSSDRWLPDILRAEDGNFEGARPHHFRWSQQVSSGTE
jgi:hypothetical protein